MPIVGITTGGSIQRALPVFGKVFKGGKRGERSPGKDLNHFRIELAPEFQYLQETVLSVFGEKPDKISPVYLLGNTPDDAFSAYKESWSSSGICLHRCTGEVCISRYNPDTFQIDRGSFPCIAPACDCKPTGRLSIVIPAFNTAAGIMGQFQLTTHSVSDIASISSVLQMIEFRGMDIFGLPFVLGRKPKTMNVVAKDKAGKATGRVKSVKSLVYLYVDESAQAGLFTHPGQVLQQFITTGADPEQTRKKLGAGGNRRIGGKPEQSAPPALPAPVDPAPQPELEAKAEAEAEGIDWLKVIDYATKEVGLTEAQMLEALNTASDFELTSVFDFEGTYTEVYGALFAFKFDYDPTNIRKGLKRLHPAITTAALAVVESIHTPDAD